MEEVIVVTLLAAMALGLAWWARGEPARLRRALSYQANTIAHLRAENDMLRRTLHVTEDALAARDERIAAFEARLQQMIGGGA